MRINDAIVGALIVAASIFIIVEARTYPALPGVPYGPDLFPTIIAGCMMLGGIILIVQGIWRLRNTGWLSLDAWARTPHTYITLGFIFAALLLYILFSEKLGFPIVSVLILFPMMLWTRGRAHVISSLIISTSFSLVVYLVFVKLMRVPLPIGFLQGIL